MSIKAAAYGQFLVLALLRRVERTKIASAVLLSFLNPNWSGPSMPLVSAASDMLLHILTVRRRRRLEGMVMGLYWLGMRESPPYYYEESFSLSFRFFFWGGGRFTEPYLEYKHTFAYVEVLRNLTILNDLVKEGL